MTAALMPDEVLHFVGAHIDSVPHLETLLLLRDTAPRAWTVAEIAGRMYLADDRAERVLDDLAGRHWLTRGAEGYRFNAASPDAPMITQLAAHYRSNLVRIAEIIHRKAPPAVLDFARAFHLRKDKER